MKKSQKNWARMHREVNAQLERLSFGGELRPIDEEGELRDAAMAAFEDMADEFANNCGRVFTDADKGPAEPYAFIPSEWI